MNNLKRILINNNNINNLYKPFIYNNRYFTTNNNNNNNNNSNDDKNNLNYKINDMVNEIRKFDLLSELKKEDLKHGFSYEKGHLKQLMELMEKEILIESQKQQKEMEFDENVYNKLMNDFKKRVSEHEEFLKKEKKKSNIKFYILSIFLGVVLAQQIQIGLEKIQNNKDQFDESWEKLRVIVTERDDLRKKKQSLQEMITDQISKEIEPKSIYSLDNEDIKHNVDSIVNELCIENKSPSDILSKSNKNLSNSKI
ncbi:hypothetical protein DICPUDRAFT_151302 [Dictyostelium purpureum]|uniref:Uncharacterized protein n=1 Tax=Dictyostelium purpureum TaxID=5786 RepID=F0ZII2_DICPU|nr:uncharacterized protein DICPUDRAFT_151302 [Dictyostelium purpureum]EGC36268.1 hypothetical protein DICPUDRAFT_151302 [Dictyostelium purpureum]|eukprot:XP_003287214.1 hypothetical protein DICPUDRAFT_151302 [Dictyostelium purpureum]